MNLHDEFFSLLRRLEAHKVAYCVVGGLAMALHDKPRFTKDIDLLTLPDQIDAVQDILQESGYSVSAKPWTFPRTSLTLHRFVKTEASDYLIVDVLVGAGPDYARIVKRSLKRKQADGRIRLARREDLVWLKRQRGSDQDQVDIRSLVNDKNRKGH